MLQAMLLAGLVAAPLGSLALFVPIRYAEPFRVALGYPVRHPDTDNHRVPDWPVTALEGWWHAMLSTGSAGAS